MPINLSNAVLSGQTSFIETRVTLPKDKLLLPIYPKARETDSEKDQRKNGKHERKFSLSLPILLGVNGPLQLFQQCKDHGSDFKGLVLCTVQMLILNQSIRIFPQFRLDLKMYTFKKVWND